MAVCLRQFSGKKMPWWNRASIKKVNIVIVTEKSVKVNNNQQRTEATAHMLHAHVAKSHNGLIKMSPEMAARILADCNFEGQRKIARPRVFSHAYAIREGDWIEDYPIHFAVLPDGRTWLVDGQHRLAAISEQSSTVGIVVRMVDVESEKEARHFYAGFDKQSSSRTNVQIIDAVELAKEVGLSNRMARAVFEAAPLLLNNMEPQSGSANVRANPSLFLQQERIKAVSEYAKEAVVYELIVSESTTTLREKLVRTGPVACALFTLRHQPGKAKEFWTGVARNDGLRRYDPRATLIQDLLTRAWSQGNVRQRVQQTSMAWNAYCEGRDLKIIKCIEGAALTFWGTPLKGKK